VRFSPGQAAAFHRRLPRRGPQGTVRFFALGYGLSRDPGSTAVRQLEHRDTHPVLVRHIVLTHRHFDHAGGLPDFPQATVHVRRSEHEAYLHPRPWIELAYGRTDAA
jgi:glyoxylase-like metal-dependent hydrolase (beta-lactamase superfamily II)